MIQLIDSALNRITMYRLALYYVAGLLLVAFGFGFVGLVPNDPTALTFSVVVILGVCWGANRLFATLLRVPANAESFYICLLYTSPSPRDRTRYRMPSSA